MMRSLLSFTKELFQNKKLVFQFSINDFKARYAGSFFGVLWAFVNPLVTVLTYWFVFGFGLKSGLTDGKYPFIVFLITGMVPWFFFSDSITSSTNVFREYSYLVKKVVFNIRILPTTKILSNLYTHLFFILITLIVSAANGFTPTIYTLQIFYYIFCLLFFLTGLTWITSSIQPFFPDVAQIINILLQTVMWTLPILWSPSAFSPRIVSFLKLNPLFYVVQGYRESFLSEGWFFEHWKMSLYFWLFTLIMLLLGSMIFKRLRPHFSDVL
ncbi:ABC transporter permease [Enterococcus sp. DIV0187]|uniref:ABC transporter permease n=1 Tax=Enterococcus sp. DIV0187 TaxID=2774644 RepID=UPI003F68434B